MDRFGFSDRISQRDLDGFSGFSGLGWFFFRIGSVRFFSDFTTWSVVLSDLDSDGCSFGFGLVGSSFGFGFGWLFVRIRIGWFFFRIWIRMVVRSDSDWLVLLSDWIGSVFFGFQDSVWLLRLVFQETVRFGFFQWFGLVGFKDLVGRYFKELVGWFSKDPGFEADRSLGLEFRRILDKNFLVGLDPFVAISFDIKINLCTYP